MKVVVFKTGKGKGRKTTEKAINPRFGFERFLFFSFIILFAALVLVQAALMNPTARTFLVNDTGLEGSPLQFEEYLYSEGEISIALCSADVNEDLKLLINGDEVAAFSENIINLKVKEGDVVSVDGSVTEEVEVAIVSASDNIKLDNIGKRIRVNSEVKQLARIIIE
ncbi:hypothetical protein [Acetivibrio mesophilus]|uniref:Uncharacterized protein n=1 Tax=Acetivibrio mesophilus TaxID=2487273 RepID=A0A4Q0I264_9FIRM|nr:hypothetical protein [Acetivibrio mesophilus]ODM25447.1 hypothetical protein A7W90_03955 [Clostridium sp. Bc-iso-3]RXE58324.1 hypothetical protein EFD62_12870 [Acetivibrio mesophilus]HHV28881.1 hypothetical protein [Clostridium sp.]